MVAKTRKRRGKKPGPKPLPRELKRKRIAITLTPKYHRQVAAHKSPGMFVEHCISLARCITKEQYSRLVDIHLVTGKTVDKLVHEAVSGYLEGIGTPNRHNHKIRWPVVEIRIVGKDGKQLTSKCSR